MDFLLSVGVLLGFGPVFTRVGRDRRLSGQLAGVAGVIDGSAIGCLLVGAAMAALTGLALRPSPIAPLLGVALVPTAASAGVDPWVVLFTVMLPNTFWLYPQQNVLYQAAYQATGARAFSHRQARPLALAYPGFVLIGLLASIPYRRRLGLIGRAEPPAAAPGRRVGRSRQGMRRAPCRLLETAPDPWRSTVSGLWPAA